LVLFLYGGAFLALAVALDRAKVRPGILSNLVSRLAAALMIAGVSLICSYVVAVSPLKEFRNSAWIAVALYAAAFFVYTRSTARTWAVVLAIGALWVALGNDRWMSYFDGGHHPRVPMFLAAALMVGLAVAEPEKPRHHALVSPAIVGSALALLALAIVVAIPRILLTQQFGVGNQPVPWQSNLYTWVAVAAPAIAWVALRCRRAQAPAWVLVGAIALSVCLIPAPELLCVALVAAVAYGRGHRPLLFAAAPLALAAVAVVYYGWQTTLLAKSLSMLAVGVVLALVAWVANRQESSQ
jgi:hypothetical protein